MKILSDQVVSTISHPVLSKGNKINTIEPERAQFRALLLQNPNYFGNIESNLKPVKVISVNTNYEELKCVGYNPQFKRLEAVVHIKQQSGYGGNLCSDGTPEYVRFYVDWNNTNTWSDVGMVVFKAYNIAGEKPLEYDVTLTINPPEKFCTIENLPKVRAILSWNNPPPANTPNFIPVWGNVKEAHIQIDTLKIILFENFLQEAKLTLPLELKSNINLKQQISIANAKKLNIAELSELYKKDQVPPHRYAFSEVHKFISEPTLTESLMTSDFVKALPANINISNVISQLLKTDGNTDYEELTCIGLNANQDTLVGVIKTKLKSGYAGKLCSSGSFEYVAFWIDWGDGAGWTYAGTTAVNIHDIDNMPSDGLFYSVFLPSNFDNHRKPCDQGAIVAKVRAILSWQVAPPSNNPDYVPTWGNREETIIQITPGPTTGTSKIPLLSSVGDVAYTDIDGSGLASGNTIHTGLALQQSPFAGRIDIVGHVSNPIPGLKYRIMRKPHGAADSAYVPLINEPTGLILTLNTFDNITGWHQTKITLHADVDGYYPLEDYSFDHCIEGSIMGYWYSNDGDDGKTFDLRIDLSTDGNPDHDVHSNVVVVMIDSKAPDVVLDINLMPGVECAFFSPGATFQGHYTATDLHFQKDQFVIRPAGPAHGKLPTPPSGNLPVINGIYTLDTHGMDACGYVLTLEVWDWTNVNSGQGYNYNEKSVGFCLH